LIQGGGRRRDMRTTTKLNELVDIRDVKVDGNLPKLERILEYLRQIRNPYHFKCGKFTVTARFADNGISIEDCLQSIVS
jgi:hypothetical protein